MGNKSCNLFIEGKGKVSVSIDEHPSMPSMSFTGLQGRGMGRVVEEKAAIRCTLRQAGFDIPMANVRIDVDKYAHEFGHKCIENACAQGIAIASGQAEMPAGVCVSAEEIEIDGSSLGLEPDRDRLERSLDDLCDEKQAEADLVEENKDRETRFGSKETGR